LLVFLLDTTMESHYHYAIMTKLDTLLEQYKKRVAILTQLRMLVESDPQLAGEIVEALGGSASSAVLPRIRIQHRRSMKSSQLDRALAFMKDGEWRTMSEIADAIHAKRTSLAPNIYRERDRFEQRKHPQDPRQVQWRLKDESDESENEVKDD